MDKSSIRKEVWDYLESQNLAQFPRPVHNRIPNFVGSSEAAKKVIQLKVFQQANTVKVNPDKPQEDVRYYALEANKTLLVPTPRLRTGLFNQIIPPPRPTKQQLRRCASREGVVSFSKPIGLESKFKVDLIVLGSVAVSKKGYRIGKGEGYADMEYAMMSSLGAINEQTLVVTTVHDCQVYECLPEEMFTECDVTVDVIVTPTRILTVEPRLPKPKGIVWSFLTPQRLKDIPVLRTLRDQDRRNGKDVTLKEDVKNLEEGDDEGSVCDEAHCKLFLGGIPVRSGIKDVKLAVKQREVNLVNIQWVKERGFCFITCAGPLDDTLRKLQGVTVGDRMLRIEVARTEAP